MEKELPPSVEIQDEELETPDQAGIEVDLEKKETPKQEVKAPEQKVDISKLHNTIAFQNRKLEQAMRELREVKEQLASRNTVQKSNVSAEPEDEIDREAQRDWKSGVKKLVGPEIEAKVQEAFSKREQAQKELDARASREAVQERSKQLVLQEYPEIEDESSEVSQVYRQVINEDPTVLREPRGPEIAMAAMERRLRQMGRTPRSEKPIVDREVNRLTRARVSSVVGKQASPNGKIMLTKEQKEFCDHYKLPYEQYAKNLKAQEASGGVEV